MIYLNENSSTPAPRKIDLENSLQQSFATLSKPLIFRYLCTTSFWKRGWGRILVSVIYGSSQQFLSWFQISRKVGVNNNTVLSPINGYSKRRTPLISGRFYFPQQNLEKIFLKSGQVISGHSA